jgi:hypothetical protein
LLLLLSLLVSKKGKSPPWLFQVFFPNPLLNRKLTICILVLMGGWFPTLRPKWTPMIHSLPLIHSGRKKRYFTYPRLGWWRTMYPGRAPRMKWVNRKRCQSSKIQSSHQFI